MTQTKQDHLEEITHSYDHAHPAPEGYRTYISQYADGWGISYYPPDSTTLAATARFTTKHIYVTGLYFRQLTLAYDDPEMVDRLSRYLKDCYNAAPKIKDQQR